MQAYIALSFSHRRELGAVVAAVSRALRSVSIQPFVFTDQYVFEKSESKAMMKRACDDIRRSDLFIAEVSYKEIGIGVEAGFASGRGKPVLYLRQRSAEHSTTVSGISEEIIIYDDPADLEQKMQNLLQRMLMAC
jgi:2'-deoxynucleoside 5'-phosphate N-hydrolase